MEIETTLSAPGATVQLVHYRFPNPPESTLSGENRFRVELCLTARHRSARGCFRDHWSRHRFERIGEVFVVPPSNHLVARSDENGPLSAIICEYELDSILNLFDEVPALTDQLLTACLDVRDAKIRNLLLRLAEEARQPGFASEMLVDLLTREMAVELVRLGLSIGDRPMQGGLATWQLRLIDERLQELHKLPTLAELARLCGISVRHLTRGFRASRGYSIGDCVAHGQMEHAKRLLGAGASVTSIAYTLGFSSSSNFCFAFRRATGMAPGEFRRTLLCH